MLKELSPATSTRTPKGSVSTLSVNDATSPSAVHSELVNPLVMLAKHMRAITSVMLADIDIVAGQDQLLLALWSGEGKTVSMLADELSIRPSTVSKMVKILLAKGLLERLPDPSDQRKAQVFLTSEGTEAQDRIRAVLGKLEQDLSRGFGEEVGDIAISIKTINSVLATRLRRLR